MYVLIYKYLGYRGIWLGKGCINNVNHPFQYLPPYATQNEQIQR